MSRPMTGEETAAFISTYGYKVSRFRVAIDALAVYVNKANPVPCLTLPQLSGIYSSNGGNIRTWGDPGLIGELARQPIALYSRNTLSGTYEYFRETALYGGDYKPTIKQEPGSEAVVEAVATDKFGIGYSGTGTRTKACAQCRSRRITVEPVMKLRPRRQCQANTQSRGICMPISTKSQMSRLTRCAQNS
jgi:phosphate transport system substrate-binding protein